MIKIEELAEIVATVITAAILYGLIYFGSFILNVSYDGLVMTAFYIWTAMLMVKVFNLETKGDD